MLLADWEALDAAQLDGFRAILTAGVLVDVHDSFLAECVSVGLPFEVVQGRRCLPLHMLEYFYARLCSLDDSLVGRDPPVDMAYGLAPSALERADDAVDPVARRAPHVDEHDHAVRRVPPGERVRRGRRGAARNLRHASFGR